MPFSFWVMSLNLRFGLAKDGPNNWSERRHAYPSLLEAFPGHFYAFQEANNFQIAFLSDLLQDHDHVGQRPSAPDRWQSNVIFYHKQWRCIHHEHFYLSDTPDVPSQFIESRWPRQCSLGIFEKKGRRIVIANTHLDFSADVQVRSARLILKRMHRHAACGPAILMGDFNSTPHEAAYAEFTAEGETPKFNNVFSPPYPGTYHNFTGHCNGEAIDWILYQPPLDVLQACVLTRPFAGRYPSDHFPVTAEFTMP